jgi:Uma2 family endonuclease
MGVLREAILTYPPLIAIEIMSSEHTLRRAAAQAGQSLHIGVEHRWIIDPAAGVA